MTYLGILFCFCLQLIIMVKQKVLFFIASIALLLSIEEFLNNHQVPVLMTSSQVVVDNTDQCVPNSCNCSSNWATGFYLAPGPSEIQKLVPKNVLDTKVHLDSYEGLRYLDHASLSRFYQCQPSNKRVFNNDTKWCSERTFLNQKSPLVALVSFHGSGNTWLRYMLEQATGTFTGSIYCDSALKAIFPGESVASANVVVIKTHHADSRELPIDVQLATKQEKYDKAIVLVRNPFDALVSEANRRWNSKRSQNDHVGLANEASFISK